MTIQAGEERPVTSIRGATTLATDFAAIATGRAAVAVLSLFTVMFTTRLLGPTGYGTVAIVSIVATLIFTCSTAWTGTSVRRYGREELELGGRLNRLTWNRALIGAPLLGAAAVLIVLLELAGALPGGLDWLLAGIALAGAVVNIIADHWSALLETSGRMKLSAVAQVTSQGIYCAAIASLYLAQTHVTPATVLLISIGAAGLVAIAVAPVVWRGGVSPVAIDRPLLRRMLWLSTPLIALMASQYVFSSVDVVVLRMYRSQHDVGIYAVAYQAYTVLSGVAVTATAVCTPLFVSLNMAGRAGLIERYLRDGVAQGLLLVSIIGGFLLPFVPALVPVVFGSAFGAAATPLAILAIGLAFLFGSYLISPILTLHEQTRATAMINAAAALINVVADVVLIGVVHMGIIAPAIATSGALAGIFIAFHLRASRVLSVHTRPPLVSLAPLAAGFAATVALSGAARVIVGVGSVAAASAVLLALHSPFRREDVELISKLQLPPPVKRVAIKAVMRFT